jgi:putrescine transport system substrate-binding protein
MPPVRVFEDRFAVQLSPGSLPVPNSAMASVTSRLRFPRDYAIVRRAIPTHRPRVSRSGEHRSWFDSRKARYRRTTVEPPGPPEVRRGKTSAAMLVIAALAFGGCGASPENGSLADSAPADHQRVVNVCKWANYVDPAQLAKFTTETGIQVNYDVFDSNDVLMTKLLAGGTGYDVVNVSGTYLYDEIRSGVFQKLDRAKIPNWRHLDPEVLQRLDVYDPGNQYAVSYMRGTIGIGYDKDKIGAIMPNAPVDSWRMVFDPLIAARFKDCGISLLDGPGNTIPLVLAYLGRDPNSDTDEDLDAVERVLMQIRPYVRMIHSSAYTDALATGEICIAVGFNGDLLQARHRAAERGQGIAISYVIPREGSIMWFDTMAIPADAPNPDAAHAYINFMQRPEVAAANANFVGYANGNASSYPLVNERLRNDPAVYPSEDVRARLVTELSHLQSASQRRLMNRMWTRFVAGES